MRHKGRYCNGNGMVCFTFFNGTKPFLAPCPFCGVVTGLETHHPVCAFDPAAGAEVVPHRVEDDLSGVAWEVGHTPGMDVVELAIEGPGLRDIHGLKGAVGKRERRHHGIDVDAHNVACWVLGTCVCHSNC